jgi:hypothetical protein
VEGAGACSDGVLGEPPGVPSAGTVVDVVDVLRSGIDPLSSLHPPIPSAPSATAPQAANVSSRL